MSSAPVQLNQRIRYLDVLRGIAISGVLFAFAFWNLGSEPKEAWTSFDKILDQIGGFLIDSKCYTTLACLFAVGFVLHMDKTKDKVRSLATYRRRLLGLLIIGAFHALLLRNGDILAPYAITCFIVTFFYSASTRTIVIALMTVFLLQVFLPEIWFWAGFSFPKRPHTQANYLVENFQWVKYWYVTSIFFWETTVFLLLFGLLVGRFFIQKKTSLSNLQLVAIIISGFVLGTGSYVLTVFYPNLLRTMPDIGNTYIVRSLSFGLVDLIHKIGLASAYASIVFLLIRRFSLSGFANLGRMSLTNYILQAVIIIPVCIVFNLFDHVTPTIALVMTGVVWVFQIFFSTWWLSRHKFGPLEWLLRWFTYGQTIATEKEKKPVEHTDVPVMVPVP